MNFLKMPHHCLLWLALYTAGLYVVFRWAEHGLHLLETVQHSFAGPWFGSARSGLGLLALYPVSQQYDLKLAVHYVISGNSLWLWTGLLRQFANGECCGAGCAHAAASAFLAIGRATLHWSWPLSGP